ncbi:MAG: enoyl-CoA hydratase-related protein [Streptosporangiaceae bacterium]
MSESPAGPPLVLVSGPDNDGVAVITLNRPEKKNALSIALREEVAALLGRMADDEALIRFSRARSCAVGRAI